MKFQFLPFKCILYFHAGVYSIPQCNRITVGTLNSQHAWKHCKLTVQDVLKTCVYAHFHCKAGGGSSNKILGGGGVVYLSRPAWP